MTEEVKELKKQLRAIYDDYHFVEGVTSMAREDEHGVAIMLEYIRAGEHVNVEQLCLLAVDIANGRLKDYDQGDGQLQNLP